jgi:hypothetical protein
MIDLIGPLFTTTLLTVWAGQVWWEKRAEARERARDERVAWLMSNESE